MLRTGFEPTLGDSELVVLWVVSVVLALFAASPATVTLAVVAYARSTQRAILSALLCWLLGSVVTVGLMLGMARQDLSWWSIPLSWIPALITAWFLRPRPD